MGVNFFLTLREEHRLRVFENGVLRAIFGPEREDFSQVFSLLLETKYCECKFN
jgi:hypothetical protein